MAAKNKCRCNGCGKTKVTEVDNKMWMCQNCGLMHELLLRRVGDVENKAMKKVGWN